MTKAKLAVLEKIFTAEMEDRLPAQLKSKHLAELITDGYVEEMELILGGRFPVSIKGYELSHFGRMTYCASC